MPAELELNSLSSSRFRFLVSSFETVGGAFCRAFSLADVALLKTLLVVCALVADCAGALVAVEGVLDTDLWLNGVAATNGAGLVFVADAVTEVFFEATEGVAAGTGLLGTLVLMFGLGLDTTVFFCRALVLDTLTLVTPVMLSCH